jgi:outer membrane biosynthesis protein TonB
MEDGSLTHFNVVKSISPILDDEAIKAIRLTNKRWTPGYINNKPVRVDFTMPVMFKME